MYIRTLFSMTSNYAIHIQLVCLHMYYTHVSCTYMHVHVYTVHVYSTLKYIRIRMYIRTYIHIYIHVCKTIVNDTLTSLGERRS